MSVLTYLQQHITVLDGGMGTLLQAAGLGAGELPERWNLTHPDIITDLHRQYYDAGSHIVSTNTFGANLLKFSAAELEDIIKAAVQHARTAASQSTTEGEKFVALDIGPTGKLLKPYGDLDFEEAVELFAATVRLGVQYGVDLILIETMNDLYETKAALLAAKENSTLPVFVSNAYGADGKLMTGANVDAVVALLEGMGADAIGVNCSLGPQQLVPIVEQYLARSSLPILVQPNAGLPEVKNGVTVFNVLPPSFAETMSYLVERGIRVVGGCCGTTPSYIAAVCEKIRGKAPLPIQPKHITCASSYTHAVDFTDMPVLIGERINPTGKKRFKQAVREHDMGYILNEGIAQQQKGVQLLDVNVGLPEIDEVRLLTDTVCQLQAVVDLPLQIDTADPVAMESALRRYNGKAMVNSVNGKAESMARIFPLVKKYGGLVVALTLDENGIPATAAERVAIAQNILGTAATYGIAAKDIVFDTLCMTVSADPQAGNVTLSALKTIKETLGCHTSLGISNVSFGLPCREAVNSTFFAMALQNGLSAAIMNPYADDMLKTYHAFCALTGRDENCAGYLAFAAQQAPSVCADTHTLTLQEAIIKGLGDAAATLTAQLLTTTDGLTVVQNEIIPALDRVGTGYEQHTVFLPQLLMSAEAAKAAFGVIKSALKNETAADKGHVIIATVKGDIHDIGKNIVKLLLENYGFRVTDLGKDVAPRTVLEAVQSTGSRLVALSALMTTTVPAMEETVQLLHREAPGCRVIVGGAVLTADYAAAIGADYYGADAMEAVRYAEKIC
ncbi:MAG: homocysteine S-methyltransferase family protein [Clostridia bacterium]|nr:homocysteine S-methyltransferase family protein [Clostridia bacterium]